jgi:hypothetical protein
VTGSFDTSRLRQSLNVRFDAPSKTFTGSLAQTALSRGGCDGRLDAQVLVPDSQTITIVTRGLDCLTKEERQQSTTWTRAPVMLR